MVRAHVDAGMDGREHGHGGPWRWVVALFAVGPRPHVRAMPTLRPLVLVAGL